MGIHTRPHHRHSSSVSSFGSQDFGGLSGCFDDDFVVNELFWGENGNPTDDSAHPLLIPSNCEQDGGGLPLRPLRRRLGAGSAIAAVTSPEIRALNLPFTPPVRKNHESISTLSPSTCASVSSPTSSLDSTASSKSKSSISQLLASLEKFDAGNSDRATSAGSLVSTNTSSSALRNLGRSAMESILEESAAKPASLNPSTDEGIENGSTRQTVAKVHNYETSGILIPSFPDEIREERVARGKKTGEGVGETKKRAIISALAPRRQTQHHCSHKENSSLTNFSCSSVSDSSQMLLKKTSSIRKDLSEDRCLKNRENQKSSSRKNMSNNQFHQSKENPQKQLTTLFEPTRKGHNSGFSSKTCVAARSVPFRERNPNVSVTKSL